jgi:predicted AAA+ superfamily ATPase
MDVTLIELIEQLNPWLKNQSSQILELPSYISRRQAQTLLSSECDALCITITGPRQAEKTTLGKHISAQILQQKYYAQLFYLNCDYLEIREWLQNTLFLQQITQQWNISRYILFIDEV